MSCRTCGAEIQNRNDHFCSNRCRYEPWTPERIETAKRLYLTEGRSAAETAATMGGLTRNAIVAIARREGWAKGRVSARPARPKKFNRRANIVWTDELRARLRFLFVVENLTYDKIAARMDLPRSSVASQGKAMGLKREHRHTYRSPEQADAQRRNARAEGEAARRRSAAWALTPTARPWIERGPRQCAWPVGEPDHPAEQMSCCARVHPGHRYCKHHLKIGRPGWREAPKPKAEAVPSWLEAA